MLRRMFVANSNNNYLSGIILLIKNFLYAPHLPTSSETPTPLIIQQLSASDSIHLFIILSIPVIIKEQFINTKS